VVRAGGEGPAVRRKGQAAEEDLAALEAGALLPGGGVEEHHDAVVVPQGNGPAVRREGDGHDVPAGRLMGPELLARSQIPEAQADRFVRGA
jgi:hypothetical protein